MGTRLVQATETSKAFLEVVEGKSGTGQTVFRLNSTTTVGRSGTHAMLVLQADQGDQSPISRLHCTILEKGEFFELRDEGSSNGTFLNDVKIRSGENHRLKSGDLIELARIQDGGLKLKFRSVAPAKPTEAKKEPEEGPKDGYTPTKLM
jgi:pSer/pThr/pTyr-binding forkhead associated (FHA) protein